MEDIDKIEGEVCRINQIMVDDFPARAWVQVESSLAQHPLEVPIVHKQDLENLREAQTFARENENAELMCVWSRRNYRLASRLFSPFLPRLIVWAAPKGAYELLTSDADPHVNGEARFKAMEPLKEWKPAVFK